MFAPELKRHSPRPSRRRGPAADAGPIYGQNVPLIGGRRPLLPLGSLLVVLCGAAYVASVWSGGDVGPGSMLRTTFYAGLLLAALLVVARPVLIKRERRAWGVIAAATTVWVGAFIVYGTAVGTSESVPYPSVADVMWWSFYPLMLVGLVMLVRRRLRGGNVALWVDWPMAALGVSALITALVLESIERATGATVAVLATNLVYPLGALILLAVILGAGATKSGRLCRSLALVAGGLFVEFALDVWYLWGVGNGQYLAGGAVDVLWLVLPLTVALAAWQQVPETVAERHPSQRRLLVIAMVTFTSAAVLVYAAFADLEPLVVILAALTLLCAPLRLMTGAERARKLYEQHHEIVSLANEGIWVLDRHNRVAFVNPRLCEMLGRSADDLQGRHRDELIDPASGDEPWLGAQRRDERSAQGEVALRRRDGSLLWALKSVAPRRQDRYDGAVATFIDLTERKAMEQKLRFLAERDSLTGLANRRTIEEALGTALASGDQISVLLLDVDHFKFVNDSFGHAAGDQLVREISCMLKNMLRDTDIIGRVGGDEFAVVLQADEQAALEVAGRLVVAMREREWHALGRLTLSIGVASRGESADTGSDLLKAADIAMYRAKKNGRDGFAAYRGVRGGLSWIEHIRSALHEERMVLYAQPIFDAQSRELVTEELLIRMRDRHGDLIPPASFIPTAEAFGLIVDIDRWAIEQALKMTISGRRLHVNLSAASVGDPKILGMVRSAAAAGRLKPGQLTLEITETAAAGSFEDARTFFDGVTEAGCRLALDDFGTGFGAFTYLRNLPISVIKIDRSFISEMASKERDHEMVAAMVRLAAKLGYTTVAEGVEDEHSLQLLVEIGVDHVQGYHLGVPVPALPDPTEVPTAPTPS